MAAIEMVQMLIEAAEYLDRRERGTVLTYLAFCVSYCFYIISELSCLIWIAGECTCQSIYQVHYKWLIIDVDQILKNIN
jgi:hypothetical protein